MWQTFLIHSIKCNNNFVTNYLSIEYLILPDQTLQNVRRPSQSQRTFPWPRSIYSAVVAVSIFFYETKKCYTKKGVSFGKMYNFLSNFYVRYDIQLIHCFLSFFLCTIHYSTESSSVPYSSLDVRYGIQLIVSIFCYPTSCSIFHSTAPSQRLNIWKENPTNCVRFNLINRHMRNWRKAAGNTSKTQQPTMWIRFRCFGTTIRILLLRHVMVVVVVQLVPPRKQQLQVR